jgi:hypothetical protein
MITIFKKKARPPEMPLPNVRPGIFSVFSKVTWDEVGQRQAWWQKPELSMPISG